MNSSRYSNFAQVLAAINFSEIEGLLNGATSTMVSEVLQKAELERPLSSRDLAILLSKEASKQIEALAQLAARLHNKYFGKAITL